MDVTIQNEHLTVTLVSKGAELRSVFNKETGLEYMWGADPAFWGKTSPVLFPIVGTLKENSFLFRNQPYHLTRHGFARDSEFKVLTMEKDQVIFSLESTPSTRLQFPFTFLLMIHYTLHANALHVMYSVQNLSDGEMYFSLGAHPAFRVPMVPGTRYEDHYLKFDKMENAPRWPISDSGLIKPTPVPFFRNTDTIDLTKTLFDQDALVFKQLHSDSVSLRATTHSHGLQFHFAGFPFLGIWAAKNADFVCIEPWCGIADSENHNQQLITKEGMQMIQGGQRWSRTWSATFF